ncbi:MOSC N-terminal beta barrel domain-containing protein [Kineococcus sp. SYSU DK006]|uniref:MOSC N-terminal beta barrel domain-containing protein n=1 Tax=Kineococcus sp. SYSU DK006 TaxID=3383127 RepID=UPI003D7C91A6
MSDLVGVLRLISTFPVKSVAGRCPQRAEVTRDGLRGDRSHVLAAADGTVLVAKHHPRLRELRLDVTGDGVGDGVGTPVVRTPDGSTDLDAFLGVAGVHLRAADGGARQVAPVHVVTTAQRADPAAGDSSRANLLLELDGPEPDPGELVGALLRCGPVELRLGERPRHCAGLFAAVAAGGQLRVGDPVRLRLPARHR